VTALRLGLIYFTFAFALGFVLGVVRILLLVPRLGETMAVALELPLILTASWFICARLLRSRRLGVAAATAMGAVAFAFLMLAEAVLGLSLGGLSLSGHLARYGTPVGLLGLGGQLLFSAFPVIQILLRDRADSRPATSSETWPP
jgi:hypothetical protein